MVSERDFVQLPYPRDLTEAGLVYARRVLLNSHGRGSSSLYDRTRRTVASAALNLGFRRYLADQGIVFAVQKSSPFTDPERYDVRLGGRTCELKSYLISRASQWEALSRDPRLALAAPALVPLDRHASETMRGQDTYAFAFVGAGAASTARDRTMQGAPTGDCWLHVLPPSWQATPGQAPLGPLVLKTEKTLEMNLQVEGLDRSGAPEEFSIRMTRGQSTEIPNSLVALSHVCCMRRPSGRLGIHSATRRRTHIIQPGDWRNIWLEGWGIILLGWITRQEFRTRASLLPQGRKVFQFDRTRTRNLAVAVSDLRPMRGLIGGVEGPQLVT